MEMDELFDGRSGSLNKRFITSITRLYDCIQCCPRFRWEPPVPKVEIFPTVPKVGIFPTLKLCLESSWQIQI